MSDTLRPLGKTIITGATGMVGSQVLAALVAADDVSEIVSLGRRPAPLEHEKLKHVPIADFRDVAALQTAVAGAQSVFNCLSTYSSRVDKATYRVITVDYLSSLLTALENTAPQSHFCLFSAASARPDGGGMSFALRVKGEAENELFKSSLPVKRAVRPGAIAPTVPREKPAFGDRIASTFVKLLPFSGISSGDLGLAMLNALREPGIHNDTLENAALRGLAAKG